MTCVGYSILLPEANLPFLNRSGDSTPGSFPGELRQEIFQWQVLSGSKTGIFFNYLRSLNSCQFQQFPVGNKVRQLQIQCAALPCSFNFARSSQFKIFFRYLESIIGATIVFNRSLASLLTFWPVNKMQKLFSAPRPTRPRNWCNCDKPNFSALSMTITLAFGTSTPTSITVVAP